MYFITAMSNVVTHNTPFDSEEYKSHTTRCFGYYLTKDEAVEAVTENRSDIWEHLYDYVVIEKIAPGIHRIAEDETWFKFNIEKKKYEPIQMERTGFVNYAIG